MPLGRDRQFLRLKVSDARGISAGLAAAVLVAPPAEPADDAGAFIQEALGRYDNVKLMPGQTYRLLSPLRLTSGQSLSGSGILQPVF